MMEANVDPFSCSRDMMDPNRIRSYNLGPTLVSLSHSAAHSNFFFDRRALRDSGFMGGSL